MLEAGCSLATLKPRMVVMKKASMICLKECMVNDWLLLRIVDDVAIAWL
jgi:hypothetical protein